MRSCAHVQRLCSWPHRPWQSPLLRKSARAWLVDAVDTTCDEPSLVGERAAPAIHIGSGRDARLARANERSGDAEVFRADDQRVVDASRRGFGKDWFVNWADVPSAIRLANGTLVGHWLQKSGPGTSATTCVCRIPMMTARPGQRPSHRIATELRQSMGSRRCSRCQALVWDWYGWTVVR